MTHDELLARIEEAIGRNTLYERLDGQVIDIYPRDADVELMLNALRAVVELHKPCCDLEELCNECNPNVPHPCPTIEAIEKELK